MLASPPLPSRVPTMCKAYWREVYVRLIGIRGKNT